MSIINKCSTLGNFNKVKNLDNFDCEIKPFLKRYFELCFTNPTQIAGEKWCITAFPETEDWGISKSCFNKNKIYTRINLRSCESLAIGQDFQDKLQYRFVIAKNEIPKDYIEKLKQTVKTLHTDKIGDNIYSSAMKTCPHKWIWVNSYKDAMLLLKDNKIKGAIYFFIETQLRRKGDSSYKKYHNNFLYASVIKASKM